MTDDWTSKAATEVRVGDRIRTESGEELLVSRIEERFFGRDMRAFIEDTPERWYKRPVPESAQVEVLRS